MAGIIQKSCVALFPLWSHKKNSKFKFDKKSCCYDNCHVIEIWIKFGFEEKRKEIPHSQVCF